MILSVVPIKVIAKLQSHVARSFGYLVAKQRVLNQNTAIYLAIPSLALLILPMRAIAFHVSFYPICTRPIIYIFPRGYPVASDMAYSRAK